MSGAGSAPYAMANPGLWGQTDLPVIATAVYSPLEVPTITNGIPSDYTNATVSYIDQLGRETNTATPSTNANGFVSTSEYDSHGNLVRSLSPANRLDVISGASAASKVDGEVVYSADALDVLESWGPLHSVRVTGNATPVAARVHVVNTYDVAHPHVLVKTDTGVRVDGASSDVDVHETTMDYTGQTGLGWALRSPTSVTVDATSSRPRTTLTIYDAQTGEVTATRQPAGTSTTPTDAFWTITRYYKGDATSGDALCDNQPGLADLVCTTGPGAQPATAGLPDLPVTRSTTYDSYQHPTVVTDTVGSPAATRTTTISYDAAERVDTTTITATGSGVGAAVAPTKTIYDPATGRATTSETLAGGVAALTITRAYDQLGRLMMYTDAAGQASTTSYDTLDRPISANDGKATTLYTYETATERRGMATGMTDNGLTWSGLYNADGTLVNETLPNGLHQCATTDASGDLTAQAYTKASCQGTIWLTETQTSNGLGQWVRRDATLGPVGWAGQMRSIQEYSYDTASRIASVNDWYGPGPNQATTCATRAYGYDQDTNRTGYWAASGATCPTVPGTLPVVHSYDAADRLTDTGYTYDPFGRITSVPNIDSGLPTPATLAASYYTNDLAASIGKTGTGAATRSYTLDPNLRLAAWSDSTSITLNRTNHYTSDADSPSWTSETTDNASWTRSIEGLDGNLAAIQTNTGTTLQLAGLHGDILSTTTTTPTDTAPTAVFEETEFGTPRAGATNTQRYQWLGAKERQTDTLTGLTLMGERLYLPTLGRFLQTDPVTGGSASRYDYAGQDPLNVYDLSGRCWTGLCWASTAAQSTVHYVATHKAEIAITVAVIAVSFIPVAGELAIAARVGLAGARISTTLARGGVASRVAGAIRVAVGVARRRGGGAIKYSRSVRVSAGATRHDAVRPAPSRSASPAQRNNSRSPSLRIERGD